MSAERRMTGRRRSRVSTVSASVRGLPVAPPPTPPARRRASVAKHAARGSLVSAAHFAVGTMHLVFSQTQFGLLLL